MKAKRGSSETAGLQKAAMNEAVELAATIKRNFAELGV